MNTKKDVLCIEFVGIFGSGKTTLINEISNSLSEKGLLVATGADYFLYDKVTRFSQAILFLLLNPLYFCRWLLFFIRLFIILMPKGKIESDIFKTLIKIHIIKNFLLLKKSPDVLLIEGAYHLLPIFRNMHKLKNKDLLYSSHTLRKCPKSYVAIIDISLETAYKRVIKDHEKRIYRFNNNELKKLEKT